MLYMVGDNTAVDPMAVTLVEVRDLWMGRFPWRLTITVRSGRKTETGFATEAAAREALLGLVKAVKDARGGEGKDG